MEPLVEVVDGNLYIYNDHMNNFELMTAVKEMAPLPPEGLSQYTEWTLEVNGEVLLRGGVFV